MSCIRFDWQESPFETGDLSYISIHILCINSMYRHIFDICCSPRKWSVHRWKLISNQHLLVYHHVPSVQIPKIVLLVIHPITSPIENHIKNIKLLVWHSLTLFFLVKSQFLSVKSFFCAFHPHLPASSSSGRRRPAASCEVPAPVGPCSAGARRPRGHRGPGGRRAPGRSKGGSGNHQWSHDFAWWSIEVWKDQGLTRKTWHFSFGFPKMGFPRFLFKHVWTNLGKRHVLAGKVGFVLQDLDCCRRQ